MAEILEIDKRSGECHECVSSGDGLQYGFTVYSFNDMYKSTRKLMNHHASVDPNSLQLQSMEVDSSIISGSGGGQASATSLNSEYDCKCKSWNNTFIFK